MLLRTHTCCADDSQNRYMWQIRDCRESDFRYMWHFLREDAPIPSISYPLTALARGELPHIAQIDFAEPDNLPHIVGMAC